MIQWRFDRGGSPTAALGLRATSPLPEDWWRRPSEPLPRVPPCSGAPFHYHRGAGCWRCGSGRPARKPPPAKLGMPATKLGDDASLAGSWPAAVIRDARKQRCSGSRGLFQLRQLGDELSNGQLSQCTGFLWRRGHRPGVVGEVVRPGVRWQLDRHVSQRTLTRRDRAHPRGGGTAFVPSWVRPRSLRVIMRRRATRVWSSAKFTWSVQPDSGAVLPKG